MIIPNFPNMRILKIGGKFEKQKTTAKQSEHPSAPRHRGHNGIFFKDRFERGGLFQYQAKQYFGNVGGGIVGEDILADERSQGLDGNSPWFGNSSNRTRSTLIIFRR